MASSQRDSGSLSFPDHNIGRMARRLCIVARNHPLLFGYLSTVLRDRTAGAEQIELVIDRRHAPPSNPPEVDRRRPTGIEDELQRRGFAFVKSPGEAFRPRDAARIEHTVELLAGMEDRSWPFRRRRRRPFLERIWGKRPWRPLAVLGGMALISTLLAAEFRMNDLTGPEPSVGRSRPPGARSARESSSPPAPAPPAPTAQRVETVRENSIVQAKRPPELAMTAPPAPAVTPPPTVGPAPATPEVAPPTPAVSASPTPAAPAAPTLPAPAPTAPFAPAPAPEPVSVASAPPAVEPPKPAPTPPPAPVAVTPSPEPPKATLAPPAPITVTPPPPAAAPPQPAPVAVAPPPPAAAPPKPAPVAVAPPPPAAAPPKPAPVAVAPPPPTAAPPKPAPVAVAPPPPAAAPPKPAPVAVAPPPPAAEAPKPAPARPAPPPAMGASAHDPELAATVERPARPAAVPASARGEATLTSAPTSQSLRLELTSRPTSARGGGVVYVVRVTDPSGQPVPNADVRMQAGRRPGGSAAFETRLHPAETPGAYRSGVIHPATLPADLAVRARVGMREVEAPVAR